MFLTWPQETDDITGSLVEQLEDAKDSGSCKPRARFFVVVTEDCRKDARFVAQGI
jgi:hypothetical protein